MSNKIIGQANAVHLNDEQAVVDVVQRAVGGLWSVVNELTRLRGTRPRNYRVSVFGSARVRPGTPTYESVRNLAQQLTEMGCDIITGGGPGLMQAANEGAAAAAPGSQGRSVGIRIALPFETGGNPFVSEIYEHQTFFSRLHHFVVTSDAFVVVPGGIGTMLELSIVWQLLQVRQMHNTPLLLVGDMWRDLVKWASNAMTGASLELASPADMEIPQCVSGIDEAVALLKRHREEWLEHRRGGAPVAEDSAP